MNQQEEFWNRAGGPEVDALSALESMRPGLRRARQRRRLALATGTAVLVLPLVIGLGMLRGTPGGRGGTEVVTATVPDIGSPGTGLSSPTTDPTDSPVTATTATSPTTISSPDPGGASDSGVSGEGETDDVEPTTSTPGSTTTEPGVTPTSGTGGGTTGGTSSSTTSSTPPTTSPGSTTTQPETTTTTTQPETTTTTSPQQQRTFTADSGGSVTVSWDSGGLNLVAVNPAPGYTSSIDEQSSTEIKVEFVSATAKTEVAIRFENGQPQASYSYEQNGGEGGGDD